MMSEPLLQAQTHEIKRFMQEITRDWHILDGNPMIELRAIKKGNPAYVHRGNLDWMDDLVEWAVGMNQASRNIYMCINPVDGDKQIHPAKGATDEDILAAFFCFADADDRDAMTNVLSFAGPKFTMSVKTGTTPYQRGHAYWRLEEPCANLQAWRQVQENIAATLGTDEVVINPSRIMRVPGTISYPDQKKSEKGYIPELVTFRTEFSTDRDPVPFERMMRAFPAKQRTLDVSRHDTPQPAASGLQIDLGQQAMDRAMVENDILAGSNWHHNVVRLVASYVAKGLTDSEIHSLTDRFTLSGYTVEDTRREVQQAIVGARAKGFAPAERPEPPKPVEVTPTTIQDFPIDTSEAFLADLKPLEYLIDGLLPKGVTYSLTGHAGHGKTTLALQFALSVARGEMFGHRTTSKGSVLILAGENPHNVKWQYAAAIAARRLQPADVNNIHFVQGRFSITQWAEVFKAKLKKIPDLKLVIIDSLQAFFEGDNDNDNTQMVEMAHKLRDLCAVEDRPAVLIIAHPAGKTPSKDNLVPRGGSAFLNEIDGNLTVWSQDASQQTLHHSQKFRGAGFEPMEWVMQIHEFDHLTDIHGTPLKLPVSRPELMTESVNREAEAERVLEAFLYTVDAGQALTVRELAAQHRISRWRADQIIKTARDEKLIKRYAKKYVLTPGGEEFLRSKSGGI